MTLLVKQVWAREVGIREKGIGQGIYHLNQLNQPNQLSQAERYSSGQRPFSSRTDFRVFRAELVAGIPP